MKHVLERHAYLSDRTMGLLYCMGDLFYTIERPWKSTPYHLGGENFVSCVPDGTYVLSPYTSEKHPNCYRLVNEQLDVYGDKNEKPGRWDILIHVGNTTKDIVGCIAIGLAGDENQVWHSRAAMDRLREHLGKDQHELEIRPLGARN